MDTAKLHALEARMDRAEARADAAAGDIDRLQNTPATAAPDVARLEALEAGIHALRDARQPAREQEVARADRIEKRLDVLEIWADGQRRQVERMETSRNDNVARMVTLYTRLRSDLLAIGNRHAWVEERIAAALGQVSQLRGEIEPRLAELAAGSDAVQHKLLALDGLEAARTQAQEHLARLEAEGTQQTARVSELHQRMQLVWEGLFMTATPEGVFLLKAGELISESARRDGAWDAHIIRVAGRASQVLRGRNTPRSTLLGIDVGAHFGLISIAIAKLFDKVISFEPNTFNAALLRANVVLNGLDDKVEVRREALAASGGSLSLAPSDRQEIPLPLDDQGRFMPGTASNLGAYSFVQDGTGLSEARSIPLDSLALDDVAFIKIDVQGADGTVLMGAMETIARCRPWVVFEWEEKLAQAFDVSFEEVERRLAGLGYRLSVLHRHNAKQIDYLALPEEEADAALEAAPG
jgi:FkbM family methyltransferase